MQKIFICALFVMLPIVIEAQTNKMDSTLHAQKFHFNQELDEPITIVKNEFAKYPQSAIKDSIEGQLYIDSIVDTAGNVKDVAIHTGVRDDLNNSALEAVRKYKFKPETVNGKPVEFSVTNCVRFRLRPRLSPIKFKSPIDTLKQ
jgi:TonB family protein